MPKQSLLRLALPLFPETARSVSDGLQKKQAREATTRSLMRSNLPARWSATLTGSEHVLRRRRFGLLAAGAGARGGGGRGHRRWGASNANLGPSVPLFTGNEEIIGHSNPRLVSRETLSRGRYVTLR